MGDRGHNRHGPKRWGLLCMPLWGVGLRLTQCGMGRGIPSYQVASRSTQPFGHNRHGPKIGVCAPFSIQQFGHDTPTLQTDGQDRTGQRSDSIGRTVLQTVTQKAPRYLQNRFPTQLYRYRDINLSCLFLNQRTGHFNTRMTSTAFDNVSLLQATATEK